MSKLVFGCGYLGHRVALRWQAEGETVFAVSRTAEHARRLAADGLKTIVGDVTKPHTLARLPEVETVLYAVGFDPGGEASRHDVLVEGLRTTLDVLPDATRRILYVSSTAVYGNAGGAWVDERTLCRPDRAAGVLALAAEDILRAHPLGSRAIVLRLAGIYGPGRIPKVHEIRNGLPLSVVPDAVVNLIHIDDAVSAVLAAERLAHPPDTFLVADGRPVLRRDFYDYLGQLLNAPAPRYAPPEPGPGEQPRGAGDKRVRNSRLVQELEFRPVYPSYREGLVTVVAR